MVSGVNHCTVGIAATMRNPDAAARPHDRLERGRQTASRMNTLNFIRVVTVEVRFSVGDEYKTVATQLRLDQFLQYFPGPHY
jgi:hypothetical protein